MFTSLGIVIGFALIGFALSGCASTPAPPVTSDNTIKNRRPIPLHTPQPKYPYMARRAGVSGVITVGFEVTETGAVANPFIVRSDDALLDEPTLEAVSQWRFEPALVDGKPVRTSGQVPISFHLEKPPETQGE